MFLDPESTPPKLYGRRRECDALDDLVRSARAGHSGVVVVHGEPGIGKSALLDYVATVAAGCRVLRVAGVESELELAFAGLHQLCRPLLDLLDRLPAPQADALGVAFGMSVGDPPDRFLVGLAALTLLAEGARDQPLVCLVDDAHWLDQASAQTLTFVARRLEAEAVVLVVATRPGADGQTWLRLPELTLRGLPRSDAERLLRSTITSPMDRRVRDRILAETRGNPLALLELPRWFSTTELTVGPHAGGTPSLTSRMEAAFRLELEPLPKPSRRLLLVAAAEPLGDVGLLWRAAEQLGLGRDAAVAAQASGLVEIRDRVLFRHPLVRSVVYHSASVLERRKAHRALAAVTDPAHDPDRRAWHLANAATEPDEAVAGELERSAERASAQGGLAASAAFLQQAALLTPDASDRARRQIGAIQALFGGGQFGAASDLLTVITNESLNDLQRARLDMLRAQIAFVSRRDKASLPVLLQAARRMETVDPGLALDSYVDALTAALFAARLAPGSVVLEVAQAARSAQLPAGLRRSDVLLQAVAVLYAEGYPTAVPMLEDVIRVFDSEDLSRKEGVRLLFLVAAVAAGLWDDRSWDSLSRRHLEIVRESGAVSALSLALDTRVYVELFTGELATASRLVEEVRAVDSAAEAALPTYGVLAHAAFRGDEAEALPLIAELMADAVDRGEGLGVVVAQWALALLYNGHGRYRDALEDGQVATTALPVEIAVGTWWMVELVEAATRASEHGTAAQAFQHVSETALASGSDWALGVKARCEAQLNDGERAESLYREAIDRLERTLVRTDTARARLLYGEWLRRVGRRLDAREQLHAAHDQLTTMGLGAFAERARRELAATGETVRKRTVETLHELTPQELHIARLAADGLTNPDIGAELFISPRTVEWHMRKVFTKLGVTARRQLRDTLEAKLPAG